MAAKSEKFQLAQPAEVRVVTEPPDSAILDHIERHSIELLLMGTVARTGLAGALMGNTAEQVLDTATCSVLTIKPNEFVSPVTLPEEKTEARP